jgi:hypothetical protein
MEFSRSWRISLSIVLLGCSFAAADDLNGGGITVFVMNRVAASPAIVLKAEAEASRILERSGVRVHWVNCMEQIGRSPCRFDHRGEFVLNIVADGKTGSDAAFGEAFLGEDGSGNYVDVFFRRIEQVGSPPILNVGQLLGAVCAHELGHLLLGSHAHSQTGIMQPHWRKQTLQSVAMGTLLFTPRQSESMQARIQQRQVVAINPRSWGLGLY